MPRARLTVHPPDDAWLPAVSRAHPTATFRVHSALPDRETGGGVVLLEVEGSDDLPAVVADLDAAPELVDLTVLSRAPDRVVVGFETTEGGLLAIAQEAGVPPSFPFTVTDGEVHWEFLADAERLAALAEQLEDVGVDYTVDGVGQPSADDGVLTPTQRRLVRAAVEHGYYDAPRGCELRDLAAEFDLAVSTCSETLRRAEGEILRRYIDSGSPYGGVT